MAYLLYKLKFPNGIHIGSEKGLEATEITINSDTFYSAIFSEYMKLYGDDKLFKITEEGNFKISNLFPFKEINYNTVFYLPKPIVNISQIKDDDLRNNIDRKKIKKINFIPAHRLNDYFSYLEKGTNFPEIDVDFGERQLFTKNKVSTTGEDTKIYNVETFKFNEDSGLYFIMEIDDKTYDEWEEKLYEVFESLSLTGIGGKKSSGYGKFKIDDPMIFDGEDFDMIESIDDEVINKSLYEDTKHYLLLSTYSPQKEEIEKINSDENCYKIIKRSGFVNKKSYSNEPQKMKQVYMLSAGSTLNFKPEGRLLDLNLYGNHSIYRMGKPIVMGVHLWEK